MRCCERWVVVVLGTASGKSSRDVPAQRSARRECDTWGWASVSVPKCVFHDIAGPG